jgi:hypothetical protein
MSVSDAVPVVPVLVLPVVVLLATGKLQLLLDPFLV